ncbi:ESAT-6-like protein EsxB [Mycobacterium marinum]|nr:ESAT-6-like protein EsxB [Mycobacterium marinum]
MAEMKTDAATLAQEAGNFERISGDLKTQIDLVQHGRDEDRCRYPRAGGR